MSQIPTIIIGGIEIPLRAFTDGFAQTYEELAGIADLRLASGVLVTQRAWPATGNYKLRTTLSGGGRLPAPLDGLDRAAHHEIHCAEHRAVSATSPAAIPVPAGRRSGGIYAPRGYALVAGELVPTPLVITDHVAALTAVSGAQHYQVRYWPKFTGKITYRVDGEPWGGRRRWVVVVEEV